MSIEDAMKHPWIKIRDIVEDISSKYGNAPEKMINVLNTTPINDSYFDYDNSNKSLNVPTSTTDDNNSTLDINNINIISSKYKGNSFLSKKKNRK